MSLIVHTVDKTATVRDTDLAERAGMTQPRDIRSVIAKVIEDHAVIIAVTDRDDHNPSEPLVIRRMEAVPTGKGATREVEVSYLNETMATLVVMRLRTPKALQVQLEVVQVFQAYRHGLLVPVQTARPPMTQLDMIKSNALMVAQMVDEIHEANRIASAAMTKADENSQRIADLSKATGEIIERQQAAIASIPVLPEPSEAAIPRGRRADVYELLRATAIGTSTSYAEVTTRAYRELRHRTGNDVLRRAQNLKKKKGFSKITGLDVVEQLGLMEQLYAICVELFGRPTNPLPNSAPPDLL